MATRTYCDHCGNTITNPKVLSFGDIKSKIRQAVASQEALKSAMAAMQAAAVQNQSNIKQLQTPEVTIVDVDLCPTCVPIWMERVGKLCRGSDPEQT